MQARLRILSKNANLPSKVCVFVYLEQKIRWLERIGYLRVNDNYNKHWVKTFCRSVYINDK